LVQWRDGARHKWSKQVMSHPAVNQPCEKWLIDVKMTLKWFYEDVAEDGDQ
jgi:hypothetical protein